MLCGFLRFGLQTLTRLRARQRFKHAMHVHATCHMHMHMHMHIVHAHVHVHMHVHVSFLLYGHCRCGVRGCAKRGAPCEGPRRPEPNCALGQLLPCARQHQSRSLNCPTPTAIGHGGGVAVGGGTPSRAGSKRRRRRCRLQCRLDQRGRSCRAHLDLRDSGVLPRRRRLCGGGGQLLRRRLGGSGGANGDAGGGRLRLQFGERVELVEVGSARHNRLVLVRVANVAVLVRGHLRPRRFERGSSGG